MADEIDPQDAPGAEAPEGVQPEGIAPEAAEPSFQDGMAEAIAGALTDDEPAAERLRGPDGRFVPKEGEKPAEPDGTKPPEAAKPPEAKPEDDPYREPEGLKADARERFQALATMAKESRQQLEQVQAEFAQQREAVTAFQQMIVETGASTEEFATLLDFAKAVKAGNWQAAEPLLIGLAQQYRVATGRDLAGPTDPFAAHPNIAQAVAQQQITPQAAQELVRARTYMAQQQQAQQQQAQQQALTQQRTAQQQEQAVQQATQSVRALTAKWQSTDLDWPKKQAILQEQATRIAQTLPADQWAFAVQTAYDAISKAMVSSVPARAPVSSASPQPLRPSGASAGRREPSSMLEAISASLG